MKISHLVSPTFKSSFSKLMSTPLPIKTVFALKKLTLKLESESKLFEETKKEILEMYGEKDELGELKVSENGLVNLDMARSSEWQVKIKDLSELELEVPKLKLEDLGDKLELTGEDLFILGDLIQVD